MYTKLIYTKFNKCTIDVTVIKAFTESVLVDTIVGKYL